ncbi:MAG: VCBS repeat-containing protein, partial [Thermoanaerobaculia bacterium]|nr:VCBS repeat-containing protein [Thermoanaerobaculia bacterium]
NWTCAQIDLSNFQNGEQVEIHFIVEDCAQGKHYGYAYIDDFCDDCSGNPSGNILFGGCREPGKICIDYELPKQNTNTGSVALKLDIFQNGTLIGTLNSPSLNTGNNYCFDIDCLKFLNKIDLSTGYDVICTGTFKLGSSNVGTKKIGSIPDGSVLGINNDCSCSPSSVGEIKLTLGKDSCLTSFPFAIQGTFILPNRPDLKNQQISLQIIQNGVVVKTLSNPSISGSGYSFALNSADFPNGECFDLIAVLSFNLTDLNGNVQTVTQTSGNIKGGGIRPGFDNDICLNCPCCTIKDVDVALLDMDYTYLPNSAASSFKIKFKVKAGPFPIQQVRASVVDWKIHYDNEDCNRCANIPNAWASLSPDSQNPNLGVLTLKNENYTYSNAQNAPKDPDISLREIIWAGLGKFQNGQDGVMHLTIPSPPNIPCCISKMDVCIKFSIYDGNCNYCEKLICKTITIDDGSICKNKTFNTTSFFANNWFFSNDVTSTPIVGDFDNDGFIDDIAYRGKCDSGIEVWRMHLSNGTDFTTSCFSADNWFFNTDPTSTPVVGDFDNDGYLDDIAYRGRCNNNNTESWRMHIGSGSGFTTKCFTASNWFYSADITSTPVVGDFDNDGFMDDIAYRGKCYNGTEFWSIHFSNGAGFTTACYTANNWFNWSDASITPVVGDFDNDGYMDDIAYRAKCGSGIEAWRIHFSNGSNFSTVSCYNASNWFDWSDPTSTPLVGDFDCDGFKDDIVYRGKCANGTESWRLHLSDGKNFTTTCYSANNWFQGNNVTNIPIVGDFDNDWYFDDIGYRGQCGNGGECWRMHIGN